MRREDLDRAIGETPQSFADQMNRTLLSLKEEKEMKRITFRTVVIVAIVAALLFTTAYALISQGLEWYYANRFTAYQEHEPEKYDAIMKNLTSEIPQTAAEDPQVKIAVTEASWAEEEKLLVVALTAEAADPEKNELHPMWNLDADGSYVGKDAVIDPQEDSEDRAEHWLWTNHGFGPVDEMIAAGKQLLLLDCDEILLDGESLGFAGMDAYVDENERVQIVLEMRMDETQQNRLAAAAKENGSLTLTTTYTVTTYTEDDEQLYLGGRTEEITFTLTLNK